MGVVQQFWFDEKTVTLLEAVAKAQGVKKSRLAEDILYSGLEAMQEGQAQDLKPSSFRLTAVIEEEKAIVTTPEEEKEWLELIDPYVFLKDEAGKKLFNTLGQRAVLDFKTANASILKAENNASPSNAQVLRRCIEEAKKGELARRYEKLKAGGGTG